MASEIEENEEEEVDNSVLSERYSFDSHLLSYDKVMDAVNEGDKLNPNSEFFLEILRRNGANIINGKPVWDYKSKENELRELLKEVNQSMDLKYLTRAYYYIDKIDNEKTNRYFELTAVLTFNDRRTFSAKSGRWEDLTRCRFEAALGVLELYKLHEHPRLLFLGPQEIMGEKPMTQYRFPGV